MNRCWEGDRAKQAYLIPRPLRLCNLHERFSKAEIGQQNCYSLASPPPPLSTGRPAGPAHPTPPAAACRC